MYALSIQQSKRFADNGVPVNECFATVSMNRTGDHPANFKLAAIIENTPGNSASNNDR